MRSQLLLTIFTLLVLFAFVQIDASACSCNRSSPCQAYANADAVFVGRILRATDKKGERIHQVQIDEHFFGTDNRTVVNISTDQSSSCAFSMGVGGTYLIYAYKHEKDGSWGTGMCSRTEVVEIAGEDLDYLRAVKKSKSEGAILQGVIGEFNSDYNAKPRKPAEVNKVYVESDTGAQFETDVAADGKYEINNLKAGKYTVSLKLPAGLINSEDVDNYYKEDPEKKKVEISGRGCAVKNFAIKTDGGVSGKVLDANGLPVEGLQVNLFRFSDKQTQFDEPAETEPDDAQPETDDSTESESAESNNSDNEEKEFSEDYTDWSEKDGSYSFKGLPAGRYLLGIEVDDYWDINSKGVEYSPMYYPNARRKGQALIIELKKAESKVDFDFLLLPKNKKRQIAGQIIWSDNRPAPKVDADLYAKRDGIKRAEWTRLKINEKGEFTIDAYEGIEYLITAQFGEPANANSRTITFSTKCFVVPSAGKIKPFKLILERGATNCDEDKFKNK